MDDKDSHNPTVFRDDHRGHNLRIFSDMRYDMRGEELQKPKEGHLIVLHF